MLGRWKKLQVVCPGLILSSQNYLGNENMLHVECRKKQQQSRVCLCVIEGRDKKIHILNYPIVSAVCPRDEAITCSFKGVQGLQTTFSLNRVSLYLPFPATLLCAPY